MERHIWLSFSISCFFTALAGSLYALLNNFADPLGLNYIMSGNIVMITVMGGMRTFWGPLVGAVLFVMLQDYVSSMTTNWMFFVGMTFVLVVLFFPRGLMGMLQKKAEAMSTTVAKARGARRHARTSAACGPCPTCRCGSRTASCARSSGRTAPARPRSST